MIQQEYLFGREIDSQGIKYPNTRGEDGNFIELKSEDIYFKNEFITIYQKDTLEIIREIKTETIDLTITSPPYNAGHKYDNYDDNKNEKEYIDWINLVAKELYRVCKIGGRCCINIPFAIKNKETKRVTFLATKIADIFNKVGFLDFEMITWHKGKSVKHFQGNNTAWGSWKSPSSPNFRPLGEVILVFSKFCRRHEGIKDNTDLSADEFKEWTKNLWYVEDDKIYKNILLTPNFKGFEHPAVYPVELIKRLIKLYSYTNDIVFDPFNGTGTTTLAAYQLNRKCIGVEISEKYCQIAKERILKTSKNGQMNFLNLVNQNDSQNSLNEVFPYKESFSPNLLSTLCEEFEIKNVENVLDPFVGTGSAFLNCSSISKIYGYDTNPFAIDISKAKLNPLKFNFSEALSKIKEILSDFDKLLIPQQLPRWNSYTRYVEKEKYYFLSNFLTEIQKAFSPELYRFVKSVLLSNLEKIFDYKRDGNGIKFRKSKINLNSFDKFTYELLKRAFELKKKRDKYSHIEKIKIFNKSSLELREIPDSTLDIIITSPPYANMFDYFEVYKMELWTGGYIKSIEELKSLREQSIRSNGNSFLTDEQLEIEAVVNSINNVKNKKIRKMLHNYFYDMGLIIKNAYKKLNNTGWMFIVVGNSFYETIPIKTDNLLAIIANNYGFNIEEMKKARTLKTSSQQMPLIKEPDKKYLRESILCLKK